LTHVLPALTFHFMNGAGTLAQHFFQLFNYGFADSSLSDRRARLPWEVFTDVMRRDLRPRATGRHKGAFWRQWRLVAIDGTQFSVTNTPQVKKQMTKAKSRRGRAAFAKLWTVVLLEIGLHNPSQVGHACDETSRSARPSSSASSERFTPMEFPKGISPNPVFTDDRFSRFGVLQCRVHEVWVRSFASSLKDDMRYTPSDCFETFPFPAGFETNAALEAAGREYYEFRAALMQDLWLGLTEIYNHFHSPDDEALARLEALYRKRAAESVPADRSPLTLYATPANALAGVQRLRTLHAAMDTVVLTAYGWTDLLPKCTCEFLLDYEDDDSESGEESSGRKKKKPWRYRWPDEVRDEVLARLLKLNAERAAEEKLAGAAAARASVPDKQKKTRGKKTSPSLSQGDLLPDPQRDFFS